MKKQQTIEESLYEAFGIRDLTRRTAHKWNKEQLIEGQRVIQEKLENLKSQYSRYEHADLTSQYTCTIIQLYSAGELIKRQLNSRYKK